MFGVPLDVVDTFVKVLHIYLYRHGMDGIDAVSLAARYCDIELWQAREIMAARMGRR